MTTNDDFNDKRRVSRSNSLLGDSFKMGASLIQGLTNSNKVVKHLTLDNIYPVEKDGFQQKQRCSLCFVPFNKINRRHHCRTCGRSCCSDCSCSTINKQRACDICIYRYQQPQKSIIKQALIQRLKINAFQYLGGKLYLDEQLKSLQMQLPNQQELDVERNTTRLRLEKLEAQLQQKRKLRENIQRQIEQCKVK